MTPYCDVEEVLVKKTRNFHFNESLCRFKALFRQFQSMSSRNVSIYDHHFAISLPLNIICFHAGSSSIYRVTLYKRGQRTVVHWPMTKTRRKFRWETDVGRFDEINLLPTWLLHIAVSSRRSNCASFFEGRKKRINEPCKIFLQFGYS